MHQRWSLTLLSCLALLAACEYPGLAHPQAGAVPEAAVRAAPAPKTAAAPASKAGQAPGVLQGTVRVKLVDFELVPADLTVRAGAITFQLQNEGRYTHDFRVEGNGVDERGPKVGAGRTMEWRIILQPGTYRISCPVSNHADRGMVGTLTVVP